MGQLGEVRSTCSKVVDQKLVAQTRKRAHVVLGSLGNEFFPLGNLDAKLVGANARISGDAGDIANNAVLGHVCRLGIDAHVETIVLTECGRQLIHRRGKDVPEEVSRQPKPVGDRHEEAGRNFVLAGWSPATECFKSHQLTRGDATQRLIRQLDLTLFQCQQQASLDRLPRCNVMPDQKEREEQADAGAPRKNGGKQHQRQFPHATPGTGDERTDICHTAALLGVHCGSPLLTA